MTNANELAMMNSTETLPMAPPTQVVRKGMQLSVQIDSNSGFCFGVVYAIEMAEEILEEDGSLYCLGDIVHNDEEVKRLEAKGLKIINHEDLKTIQNSKVQIGRAHV